MALNYTATVRLLRVAIPAAGGFLLLLLILWPYISHIFIPHLGRAQIHSDRIEMINPKYHSADGEANPYIVTAARAIQYRDKPDIVTLQTITGELHGANDQTFHMRSNGGTYNRALHNMLLNGHVVLTTDDGSEYVTEQMTIDLTNKAASGDQPVDGTGPAAMCMVWDFLIIKRMVCWCCTARRHLFWKTNHPPNIKPGKSEMMLRYTSLALVLSGLLMLCCHMPLYAQDAPVPVPEGATQIDATDALEWNKQAQTYTARGDARAQKGDMVITADVMIAHYRNKGEARPAEAPPADAKPAPAKDGKQSTNNIYQLEAHGHVHIVQGDYTAQGDDGTYNVDKQFYRLTGTDLKATTSDTVITARDSLDYDQATDRAYARGNGRAVQADKRVDGDVLTGIFALDQTGKRALKFVNADGHAVMTSPQDIVRADHGVYDLTTQLSTVTGNVKITQGQNQLEGQRGEMNMQTGISRLLPAVDQFGQKTRVRVLLYQDNASTAQPPATSTPAAPNSAK